MDTSKTIVRNNKKFLVGETSIPKPTKMLCGSDRIIVDYIRNKNNGWTSVRDILDGLNMPQRTTASSLERMTKNDILETKVEYIKDANNRHRDTRLYRIKIC